MGRGKKILVTGAGGLLGSEFRSLSKSPAFTSDEIVCLDRKELDITQADSLEKQVERFRPDYLINCAAYTQVDRAEEDAGMAEKINIQGTAALAEACLRFGSKLVHFSTDFVFDGSKKNPYVESDIPAPLNAYGRTKLEGERVISSILPTDRFLILRISWPYGRNGKNFIHQLWELSKTREELRVVADQTGVPNPAPLLAEKTLEILEATGLFHLSCTGACSRFELISFLLQELKSPCRVIPVSTEEFPSPAKRPPYSALASERASLAQRVSMPEWKEALVSYLQGLS